LDNLEKFIHKENDIDPLIISFMVHYQFETIHPFLDGNGRVGRLLLSLMIYENCGLSKPWLYLSAFFDKYKDEYINLLFGVVQKEIGKIGLRFACVEPLNNQKMQLNVVICF
ncbi:MAG: Fic family protein, partial [Cyanobacteria bacterium P01_A01_bin.68]